MQHHHEWVVREFDGSLESDLTLRDGTKFNYVKFFDGLIQVAFWLPNGDMVTFMVSKPEEYISILDMIEEGLLAAELLEVAGMYQPAKVLEPNFAA